MRLSIVLFHTLTDGLFSPFVPHQGNIYSLTIFGVDAVTLDLLLAQDGDDLAFSRVMRECEEDVRRFCRWFSQIGDDIDDVTQETFLRAFRGLQSFKGDSTAKSWLVSIARRVCLDLVDKRKKDQSLLKGLIQNWAISNEEGYSIEIRQLIDALPTQFREAFVLVRVLGNGYDEAAFILQCPRGTVQSRVARAREFLAREIMAVETRKTS